MAVHWMQRAVKHPGALTRSAMAAGMSVQAFARKHRHDKGVTGERARLDIIFANEAKKRKGRKSLTG
jgi:hypothetical protein